MTTQEVAGLARELAKTGLVIEAKGIPEFQSLAEGADLDARVLRHDVERRHRVFKRVLEMINHGVEQLPDNGSPKKTVDSAIRLVNIFFEQGKTLHETFGDGFNLRYVDSENYEHTDPNGSYSAEDRHALERIGVTYVNATRVAYDYNLIKSAVPLGREFKAVWKELMGARKNGILYGHKFSPRRGAHDFQLIDDTTIEKMAKGGKKIYLSQEAFGKLQEMRDAIPAMKNRKKRKQELAEGSKWWEIGERIANDLWNRLDLSYNLLINGLGTGKWVATGHRPYFEAKPNFSSSRVGPNGPTFTRNVLERITDNFRGVASGNDYHFKEMPVSGLLESYVHEGLINETQSHTLESDSKRFIVEANKALNACRS